MNGLSEPKYTSQEYANFLDKNQEFVQQHKHYLELATAINKSHKEGACCASLFQEAVEANNNAIKAYTQAMKAYKELIYYHLRKLGNEIK